MLSFANICHLKTMLEFSSILCCFLTQFAHCICAIGKRQHISGWGHPNSRSKIPKSRSRNQDPEIKIPKSRSRNQDPEIKIQKARSRNQDPEIKIPKSRSRNQDPEIKIPKSRSRNQDPEIKIPKSSRLKSLFQRKTSNFIAGFHGNCATPFLGLHSSFCLIE